MGKATPSNSDEMFSSAEWYDKSINWSARLERELPVLMEVFGFPGAGRLLDAGCGTGRVACALASHGYRVVGADLSPEMLSVAQRNARTASANVELVHSPYATLFEQIGGGFDGVYCQGNSLAAAGTRDTSAEAVDQFARSLRPGGRFFLQILNFARMRSQTPCVRGPRVSVIGGVEYVSVRSFHFDPDSVRVTNITLWKQDGWKTRSHCGTLYPIRLDEIEAWCQASGLRIDKRWGSYAREPFDADHSVDLIITATRVHYSS